MGNSISINLLNNMHIQKMNDAIKHRGSDDSGIFTDTNLALGHQRLSIIDLSSAGHQSFTYNHKIKTLY
jgi:asparagine synthase (glutamine-hydrolysing)